MWFLIFFKVGEEIIVEMLVIEIIKLLINNIFFVLLFKDWIYSVKIGLIFVIFNCKINVVINKLINIEIWFILLKIFLVVNKFFFLIGWKFFLIKKIVNNVVMNKIMLVIIKIFFILNYCVNVLLIDGVINVLVIVFVDNVFRV